MTLTAGERYPLEPSPRAEQCNRLEDFLTEMLILGRRYRIVLDTSGDELRFVDLLRNTTIGIGLSVLVDDGSPARITDMDCDGSILDGVWLVDTPDGPKEQRHVATVTTATTWPEDPQH